MDCPYCQKEMDVGYIYSGKNDLKWTPESEKRSWIINYYRDNEVKLAALDYLKGCQIKVYRCPVCQIQIINEKDL